MGFKVLCITMLVALVGLCFAQTPGANFDCDMRKLAMTYAKVIQPDLNQMDMQELADALSGSATAPCSLPTDSYTSQKSYHPRYHELHERAKQVLENGATPIFVSPNGDDSNPGTDPSKPKKSIQAAIVATRTMDKKNKGVVLLNGTFMEGSTVQITPEDSGLSIVGNPGPEPSIVSGGRALTTNWKPAPSVGKNVYVTDIDPSEAVNGITGLRLPDGQRAIRARYPNADPEVDGVDTNPTGWIENQTTWMKPKSSPLPTEILVNISKWTRNDSTGNELSYQGGVGGSCAHLDPPFGYWCSMHPARTPSGGLTHRSPAGVTYKDGDLLPHAPYKNPEGAIVHSCRGGANCWFTWMWEVDADQDGSLTWTRGGFQGAEGADSGGVWYVENVMEELDYPREYFYDQPNQKLYYVQNGTGAPPSTGFVATDTKVLFNISGTMENPVVDVSVYGVVMRDTAYTYMDPHGMPSGGDWCLQRSGAVVISGAERVDVSNCTITRVDGNAIFVGGYARKVAIADNKMQWVGDTAIALWGKTKMLPGGTPQPDGTGIDGTDGEQPRFTYIAGNLIHELGHYQKQSSMVFQAQSCQTYITHNIFYNGPRAHINFNDQFGGANLINSNLIFNSCRETADHGAFNSWGRQPYITKVRDGVTPSITPADTNITNNFVISNYNSHEAIDNDDASEYFNTNSNFFVYGANGLKSDFEGHDNRHHNNLYAFVNGNCFGIGSFKPGHEDGFYNNTCIAHGYGGFDCSSEQLPEIHDNRLYFPNPNISVCGKPFAEWQKEGNDKGTTISSTVPETDDLLSLAKDLLLMN
eukprot:m.29160 g.29160  ORF g.29160 m.29160 type:complete len:811 (+) comp8070_c0_seq1:36-2468(+)